MTQQARPFLMRIETTSDVMRKVIDNHFDQNVLLSIPAVVTNNKNYETQQCIDVKALIGTIYPDGDIVNPVNIKNVFVKLPSGGGFDICLPISVGDKVTLHWTHKSLNAFLSGQGEQSNEALEGNFQRKDCYAVHGFGTRFVNQSPSKTNMIVRGDNSETVTTPEGDITTAARDVTATCRNSIIECEETVTANCKDIVVDCENATVGASVKVVINTPLAEFSTDVLIKGKLDVIGNVDSTGDISSTGEVSGLTGEFGGISSTTHTHIDAESRPTSGPQ